MPTSSAALMSPANGMSMVARAYPARQATITVTTTTVVATIALDSSAEAKFPCVQAVT